MSLILYGIFRRNEWQERPLPKGVAAGVVTVVSAQSLGAAISRIEVTERVPDLARIQSYQQVVEALFEAMTIIPMRYGNVFETPEALVEQLDRSAQRYLQLLDELTGSVEMGIRGFWPDAVPALPSAPRPDAGESLSGRAYLLQRKSHYALEEQWQVRVQEMRVRCEKAFAGLYRKMSVEDAELRPLVLSRSSAVAKDSPLVLSISFLILRKDLAAFQSAFRELAAASAAKLLLSGPWPPFSFAAPPEVPA